LFEAALLNQVEERGEKREQKGGVGGEKKSNVQKYPTGMNDRERGALLARVEGGEEAKEEADRKDEDTKGYSFVAPVDQEKRQCEKEAEKGLGLVSVHGEAMVGGVEHLGEGDKVEEYGGDGGGDGAVPPAGSIVQGRG
jgi:hypothetical protein